MYKIKNKELQKYMDNNEAIEADCGTTTLISLEDVDIVIERVVKNLTKPVVRNCPFCKNEMKGIKLIHYKCPKCEEYFTD